MNEPSPSVTTRQRVRDNLLGVRERIEAAALSAARRPSDVKLVGVTKYVDAGLTAALVEAGCADLGESRPQELWRKAEDPRLSAQPGVRWHQIGHLQRNKVDRTVPLVHLIHTADSERLLRAIHQAATALGAPARVLLEVNISGDAQKHGLTPEETRRLAPCLGEFPGAQVEGLMAMASGDGGQATASQNFEALRLLRDELQGRVPDGVALDELSMGMSGDFEQAIRQGATIVRIGSALWDGC